MNGVEIIPSDNMTYLGVVLDKKNWIGMHISRQKFPNVGNFWQCSGLPLNITGVCPLKKSCGSGNKWSSHDWHGCHVWGHSLMKTQMLSIRKVARLALVYFAPMWKSTPTAGLEIILNQKPPHIEIQGGEIKSYIKIKDVVNKLWDGIAYNNRSASHLLTLKNVTKTITHDGIAINLFKNDYLRKPLFNWNPPTHSILTITCDNDVDDDIKQLDFNFTDDTNHVADCNKGENPLSGNDHNNNFATGENQCVNNVTRGVVNSLW